MVFNKNSIKKIKKFGRNQLVQTYNKFSPHYTDFINIILWINRKGLYNDGVILQRILTKAGFKVRLVSHKTTAPLMKSRLNIFIQYIYPQFLKYAKHNVLVPNPEWGDNDFDFIKNNFDGVIAKTKDCENIFRSDLNNVYYTSFTSNDVYMDNEPDRKYVHFAGASPLKGTKAIINLWNEKINLPKLYLYSYDDSYKYDVKNDNIVYRHDKLSDAEMKLLQNKYLFHVCPSEYEGFGHQINEAKSAMSIVFTTDAPPMNELISTDYGYLIKSRYKGKLQKGNLYSFEEDDLYEKIVASTTLTNTEINERRLKARESYQRNDTFFKNRVAEVIGQYFN